MEVRECGIKQFMEERMCEGDMVLGIQIKLLNTKIDGRGKALNNLRSGDMGNINIEMDHVEVTDKAELLNEMIDMKADEGMEKLKNKSAAQEVLRKQLPNLVTGTLANVIGNIVRMIGIH